MKEQNEKKIYKSIITGLNQAIDYEKGKLLKGVRKRRVTITPIPHYGAKKVKSIRNKLGMSQLMFAKVMGVSKKTVEAWESGRNEPQGPAQRMFGLLEKENDLLEKYEIVYTE